MPAIIKPSRISVAHQTEAVKGGALTTVSAFVLFDFAEPGRLLTEQALWPMVTDQMPNGAVFDKGQLKPRAELMIAGSALSPADTPVEGMKVSVRFGSFQKQLAVFGNRYWRLTDQGIQMTRAEPFMQMPIGDVQAFGGQGYAPNQRGKGFGARQMAEAGYDAPLPNVEDPRNLIKSVDDLPMPAHFGPLPADDAARLRYLGTYDQHWIDHVSPVKPDDFNPLYHCEMPEEQRFDAFFEGGETFAITGMSRGTGSTGGEVPRLMARCFYKLDGSNDLVETTMRCDTITLFPNVEKATMAFRGLIRGKDRFAEDITNLMVAIEDLESPRRPADYYVDVFKKRTSKDDAHKYALADWQLLPEVDQAVRSAKRQAKLEKAAADRARFMDNQNWAAQKMLEDQGLPGDLIPPPNSDIIDDIPLVAHPTQEEIENGDLDLAELLDDVKAVETAVWEKRDREMVKAELQRRAIVAATPPKLLPPHAKKPIVDDELMAKFPDIELDPDLEKGLSEATGQLTALRERSDLDLPEEFKSGNDAAKALDDVLDGLFDEEEEIDPEEIEAQYKKAVARAMRMPEGSILSDARKAMNEMDLSPLDNLDSQLSTPSDAIDDTFAKMIGDLESPKPAPQAEGPDAPLVQLFPEDGTEGFLDPANDPSKILSEALDKIDSPILPKDGSAQERIQDLMKRVQDIKPEGQPDIEGKSPGELAVSSVEGAKEKLDEADETIAESMVTSRQQSPAPLFPLEALPADVPARLGSFVLQKLDERYDFKGADLAGADLRGADFSGMDLTDTFFEQTDLTGATFKGSNLSGAVFAGSVLDEVDFTDTNLAKANFSKTTMKQARLVRAKMHELLVIHADWTGTDASGADLGQVRFIECTLDALKLDQTNMSDCQFLMGSAKGLSAAQASIIRTMFVTLPMDGVCMDGSRLERIGFMEVPAAGSSFVEGDWLSVGFMGACDLTQSRFDSLRATECSFNTAKMSECCFLRAKCNSCFFNTCDMEVNDFRLASFHNSLFGRSNFAGSDFFGANLFGAALTGADLRRCSMRSANLYAANLLEAKLASCDFSGANLGMTMMEQPTHA
ncbi:DUF2169 family type VI secretion system accessory protein [Roseibium denhamense]|uniref:DUF2169 domain-containing protein n=1 Tax=Roseibium denhamense TaxID=76305 RepID=A0ABY1NW80_9HYPH|nr:DUF2169 domain-containing protein [Roseibium denhamense]SMP19938.1 hypothetical protein SAMN06265374_2075 [Roseibium denhamense]